MERQTKFKLWYLAVALLSVLFLRDAWVLMRQVEPLPYGAFMED